MQLLREGRGQLLPPTECAEQDIARTQHSNTGPYIYAPLMLRLLHLTGWCVVNLTVMFRPGRPRPSSLLARLYERPTRESSSTSAHIGGPGQALCADSDTVTSAHNGQGQRDGQQRQQQQCGRAHGQHVTEKRAPRSGGSSSLHTGAADAMNTSNGEQCQLCCTRNCTSTPAGGGMSPRPTALAYGHSL